MNCSETVYDPKRASFHKFRPCKHAAVKDGLCARHQPEAVAEKIDKRRLRWAADSAREERERRLASAAPELLAALKEIESGQHSEGALAIARAAIAKAEGRS